MGLPANRSDSNGVHHFTFGTFLVGRGNRTAFEACSDLANLRELSPQPVMLVGPAGAGKTHLLYAMANRVRQSNAHVGLVCISAHQFPQVARELAHNPEQVERASRALLLIDQLDRFDAGLEELEGLVAVFAGRGHGVVLSSQEPPENLPRLSDSFRELLGDGTVIRVRRDESNGRANGNGARAPRSRPERPASAGQNDAEDQLTWGAVRTELGQAHTQLSMAIHEMQRLRDVNARLNAQLGGGSATALTSPGHALASPIPQAPPTRPRHEALAVLQRTETLLNELRTSRVEFESLQAANAKHYAELRQLSEEAAAEVKEHAGHDAPATAIKNGDQALSRRIADLTEENARLHQQVAAARAEGETNRARLKQAHESLGRLEHKVQELRRRVTEHDGRQDAGHHTHEEESNGMGEIPVTPHDLAAPLAQLEEAARTAAETEATGQVSDETEAVVGEVESLSTEAPPSSLYHVEELSDDLDFMDDPPDSDESTDER